MLIEKFVRCTKITWLSLCIFSLLITPAIAQETTDSQKELASQLETDEANIEKAKQLFEQSILLSHQFDPAVAGLYSDEAVIKNIRHYPFGQKREMVIPIAQYKSLMRNAMPIAKMKGDRSTYSDVTYVIEGDKVRIKATRYSELKNYYSPYSLLVGPDKDGKWLIYEETSESKPF